MPTDDFQVKQTTMGELNVDDIVYTAADSYYVISTQENPEDTDFVLIELQSVDSIDKEDIFQIKQTKTQLVTAIITS